MKPVFHFSAPGALTSPLPSLPAILHTPDQNPVPGYSKGSWGLSVLLRVSGIFTGTTTSPRSSLRQRPQRYTIRAGRNLPDKEFRYLRTVIVTADIHGGFGSELRGCPLTPCLDLSALVTCHTLYVQFTCWQSAVFLLNSRMGPFTAPPGIALEDPFFRSYGAILPSSLTRFLSRALVSLYPPTCVGFGTGCMSVSRHFSRKHGCMTLDRASPILGTCVPARPGGNH